MTWLEAKLIIIVMSVLSAGVGGQYGGAAQRRILQYTNRDSMFSDVRLLKLNPNSPYTWRYFTVLEPVRS